MDGSTYCLVKNLRTWDLIPNRTWYFIFPTLFNFLKYFIPPLYMWGFISHSQAESTYLIRTEKISNLKFVTQSSLFITRHQAPIFDLFLPFSCYFCLFSFILSPFFIYHFLSLWYASLSALFNLYFLHFLIWVSIFTSRLKSA